MRTARNTGETFGQTFGSLARFATERAGASKSAP
jgi:hypothetical protein